MKIATGEDGVTEVTFHQSFIGDFLMCPARARWNAEMYPDGTPPSTATAIGTGMHAGIEEFLNEAESKVIADAITAAYIYESEVKGFIREMTDADALRIARDCYKAWLKDVYPEIKGSEIQEVECRFRVLFDEYDGIRIYLGGVYDARINGIQWDWKTAGSMQKYQQWQVDRILIQPTVYTAAKAIEDGVTHPVLFKYGIVQKKATPVGHVLTTIRGPREWQHLKRQIRSIWNSYKNEPLLNDQGWWCAAKWCAHYDTCKGAPIVPGPVGVSCSAPTVAAPPVESF